MRDDIKGIRRLTPSAPVAPLKQDHTAGDDNPTIILFCNDAIEELATPMQQEEFFRKEKELEAKYPGICS